MKIYDTITQGSEEWFNIRKMKLTASKATAIISAGKGLETLVYDLLSDKYSGYTNEEWEGNSYTENGNELEDVARGIYEMKTGNKIEQVGFIELNENVGCSPDGLVGDDGLWECKWKKNQNYFRDLLEKEKPDSGHFNQAQFQMYVTGRKWCDLSYYNPNFKKSINTIRIERDPTTQEKIKLGVVKGIELLKSIESKYNNIIR